MSDNDNAPTPELLELAFQIKAKDERTLWRYLVTSAASVQPKIEGDFPASFYVIGPGCTHWHPNRADAEQDALAHMEKDDAPYFVVEATPFFSPDAKKELVELRKEVARSMEAVKRRAH